MAKLAVFQDPIFQDEAAAREALEAVRWPLGPYCPHCGNSDQDKIAKLATKSARPGLHYCNECKGQFTVTVGTVFERSKVPLTKWWLAAHLFNQGKNGASAHEIHRQVGVTYKTAWFMMHRLREAMTELNPGPMGGGNNEPVEMDETYYGNTSKRAKGYKRGLKSKASVVALVDGKSGKARAFHVPVANVETVKHIARTNVVRKSTLVTDEAGIYTKLGKEFSAHQTVAHKAGEYRNQDGFSTNKVENFFLQFKRGMRGTYVHCDEQHVQRYLDEFAFRYNHRSGLGYSDGERTALALKGIEGKRLTYRPTN